MTYQETLDFLYARLPMFHRIGPAAFKKDLTNTLALCEHLGNPQHKFRSVHVGGTNGKGSVSYMLAAACQVSGLKTGLYVSPHYKDFRERIKVDGQYIPKQAVVQFITANLDAIERIQPSFFELCVAMAFDWFARQEVDIAIIEVGLGGRLDSTNVITPLLSVITNISYDHQNMLGDTLSLIAGEKAGIIKPGIPAVIGERHSESAPVFEQKARESGAPIVFADAHFTAMETSSDWNANVYNIYKNDEPYLKDLIVDAGGPFQAKNVATALQAIEILDKQGVIDARPENLRQAFGHLHTLTRFMGRWQRIGQKPDILCDSAHNEAGLRLVFERIAQGGFGRPREPQSPVLHIVTGFVNDKEVDKVLGLFPSHAKYYFAKADIPRGLDAEVLREKAAAFGMKGKAYRSVRRALSAAKRSARQEDLILVIGSIFVAAEVL